MTAFERSPFSQNLIRGFRHAGVFVRAFHVQQQSAKETNSHFDFAQREVTGKKKVNFLF